MPKLNIDDAPRVTSDLDLAMWVDRAKPGAACVYDYGCYETAMSLYEQGRVELVQVNLDTYTKSGQRLFAKVAVKRKVRRRA